MRIDKLHIEQFGIFSDYSVSFTEEVNRISRPNGWGKTTMTVFIRAMFYGFPTKGERSGDRERYRPFNEGIYGGQLTFTTGGHSYTIFRTFGKAKSGREDAFRLIDEETKLESARWSARIGEELFGINEESFVNSAWIRQDGCNVTGDLSARISKSPDPDGNPEILEDLRRYDQVMEDLKMRLNKLSPNRKTGLLYRKRIEKQTLEGVLLRIPVLENSIGSLKKEREQELALQNMLRRRQEQLLNLQKQSAAEQDLISLRKMQDALQKEYLYRDEIWERYLKKFPSGIPKEENPEVESSFEKKTSINKVLFAAGLFLLAAGILLFAVYSRGAGLLLLAAGGLLLAFGRRKAGFPSGVGEESTALKNTSLKQEDLHRMLLRQREISEAEAAWKELQRADRELRAFYKEHPSLAESEAETGELGETPSSILQINESLKELTAELQSKEDLIRNLDQRLGLLEEEREELSLKEEEFGRLAEEVAALEKEVRITEKTARYLKQARDSFSARYRHVIQASFQEYYKLLDPEQKEELYLDSEYRICVIGGGLPRSEEVLSQGYKSLTALCLRFALLDAMYEKEPPAVILDDPFVYLDDEKTKRALAFLKKVSKKYQIFYFTCSENR